MERDRVFDLLSRHQDELDALGVRSLALFGSIVRGDHDPDSDVDILVEFACPIGFFAFLDLKDRLEQILGRPVDLVSRKALHPRLRDAILNEAVHAR
jgi:predicted nucleotidyltransferase